MTSEAKVPAELLKEWRANWIVHVNDRTELQYIAEQAAAYGAAQKWISVAERLPELHEPVLISNGTDIGHARKRISCWEIVAGNTQVSESNVTHWMPLPAPPAQEKQNG